MPTNNNRALGEPRGRGRPKKDEVVAKPFVVHRDPRIKPENELKYAEEAIRNANNLYKRYRANFPNPLNIDVKNLCDDARMVWDWIFSKREYTEEDVKRNCQNDRVLEDAEEVLFAFEAFTDHIRRNNFVRTFERPDGEMGVMPFIPNQSSLARWLGISQKCVSKIMSKADNKALQTYKRMLADCLSEGAMAGIYQSSSTVFALKNMCDWADKYEERSINKNEPLAVKEAEEVMAKLGYTRPSLIGGLNGKELPSPSND